MKSKLIGVISLIILAVTIFLLFEIHHSTEREVIERFQAQQLVIANQLSKELQSYLSNDARLLELLSSSDPLKKNNKNEMADAVQECSECLKKDQIKSISVYNEKGTIIYSTLKDAISLNHFDSKFFKWGTQRENKGKQFITTELPLAFSRKNNKSTLSVLIATPIYRGSNTEGISSRNEQGAKSADKMIGVVIAVVDVSDILASLSQYNKLNNANEKVWLLDNGGTVLYQPEHTEMVLFNIHQQDKSCLECHGSFNYIKTILSESSGTIEYQLNKSPKKLSSFATLNFKNLSWKIVVNIPLDEVSKFVGTNLLQTLLLFAVVTFTLIGFLFSILRSNRLKLNAETEAEKLRAKQSFNLILESAAEGIFGLDLEGNHTFVNLKATELLGYKIEELIGKHSHALWHHSRANGEFYPDVDCPIYATLNEGTTHIGEEYFWRKDGTCFPVDFSTTPIWEDKKIVGAVVAFRDITKRKLAEEALRASEERFRSVAQSAKDAIIIANKTGIILGWNSGAERIFGFTEKEIIGQSLELIIPVDQRENHKTGITRIATSNERHVIDRTVELQGLHKNGCVFPLELSLSEWETNEGKYFTGIIRDITVRKRAELERQVMYEITQGVTTTSDLDELLRLIHSSLEKIIYAENIFIALYNQNTEFFSFPYFVDKFDPIPEPTAMRKSCTAYVFRTGKPLLLTTELFNQLNEENEVELVGSPSPSWVGIPLQTPKRTIGVLVLQHYEQENKYSEGDVNFLSSVASQIANVIERKLFEQALRESETELKVIIESTADGILAVDSKGKVIKINKRFAELWHIKQSVIDNEDDTILLNFVLSQLTNPEEFISKVQKLYNSTEEDLDLLHFKDGRIFERYSTPLMMDDSSVGRVWSFRDITNRIRSEEEIKNRNEQLSKLNAEKDKFFSIIAHDLKSPFSGFIGLTEMMAEDINSFSQAELSTLSKEMHSNAKNLFKLLSNLLDWARMQQDSLVYNPRELFLAKEVSQNIDLMIKRGEQKGIEMILEIPEDQTVYADEAMLNSILRNLLSNAVKFTAQGGKIIVTAKENENNKVEVAVSDSGVGMSADLSGKLFKIEEKVERIGTEGESSTGLGLLLCKEFVEKHGGRIWVESKENVGSTFYFTLPHSNKTDNR